MCGVGYGQRSAERTNQRNGYRYRQFDTGAGTLDLAIPKLRHGSYFPDWLLERRACRTGVDHRGGPLLLAGCVDATDGQLVETLGITGLSKSHMSVMGKELDTAVETFRSRRSMPARTHLFNDNVGGPPWIPAMAS